MHTFFIWLLLINIMKLFINEFCSYVSLRFLPQGLVTMSKRTFSAMLFSRSRYILKNWPTPGCHFSQITLMESIKSVWLKEKSAVKFQHYFQQNSLKGAKFPLQMVNFSCFSTSCLIFFYNDRILGQAGRKIGESVGSISRGPTPGKIHQQRRLCIARRKILRLLSQLRPRIRPLEYVLSWTLRLVLSEVGFLEEIQTEVLRVFLLAIHRHLY